MNVRNLIRNLLHANMYSTTERKVGAWIDGKPIYRKVYNPFGTKDYAQGTTYDFAVDSGIDKIIRFDVLTTGNSNNNQEVNRFIVPYRYDKSANKVYIEALNRYQTNTTHVILEYTKSGGGVLLNSIFRHREVVVAC